MTSPSTWQEIRLGDVVQVIHGWPFKSEYFCEWSSSLPVVVGIGNFQYTGGFRFDTTQVKGYQGDYPKEYGLSPGDIILIMTCQTAGGEILGIPGRIPDNGVTYLHNQRMGKVLVTRPDLVDSDYLYWIFLWKDFNQELVASSSGTKIVHTAPKRIEAFRFTCPPLSEQRAIARILGSLDDKIELNRRINRTLEAMAQALFKSWFVDFDPVIAKREGRRPFGMDAATASLFPEHFQETAMGPIPSGWRIRKTGDEFNITMGQSPPGSTYNENGDGLSFYQGRTDFGFRYPNRRVYCSAPTRFAERGDTLVSVRAPVGDINKAAERCCIGRGVASVRHRGENKSFAYYMMQSLKEEFGAYEDDGTLFGAISKEGFHNMKISVPGVEILDVFSRIVGPIDARIEVTELQIQHLSDLREKLLPRLLSGEIRVGQAERFAEEA